MSLHEIAWSRSDISKARVLAGLQPLFGKAEHPLEKYDVTDKINYNEALVKADVAKMAVRKAAHAKMAARKAAQTATKTPVKKAAVKRASRDYRLAEVFGDAFPEEGPRDAYLDWEWQRLVDADEEPETSNEIEAFVNLYKRQKHDDSSSAMHVAVHAMFRVFFSPPEADTE